MRSILFFSTLFCILIFFESSAQYTPFYQWTLLPQTEMDEIIGESSGESALNHVIEMVGYQRNRPRSEYGKGTFREGQYVLNELKKYGIQNAKIERFEGGQTWDGIKGELWETVPNRKKLADYDDIALSLAQGSQPTNVKAELVWVEEGSETDLQQINVEDKIVLTSGSLGRVHNLAVKNGALGVVSFGSSRELTAPLAIPAGRIYGDDARFGFYLTPREGYKLRDRLIRGEQIEVHAVVESETLPYDLQVPTCYIPGSNPNAGEIILSAHIFEGYTKQGANDNVSGSAVILEVARMFRQMIDEGRLKQPERGIRFIWVPEYSGTIPWVNANKEIMSETLCNINLDMVGLHLKENNSFYSLMRTTFGNPHYVNDVLENYFVYMGEANREILANRSNKRIANQIIAPSGSEDPFYYQIEQHYGSSDHEVFNHWSTHVPGVMLITWPDMFYHTSEDIPNKLDPTQLKRAIVIAAAAAYNIASADEKMAIRFAETVYANSSKRMGIELSRALDELRKCPPEEFTKTAKKVKGYLETTYINELGTLHTTKELASESQSLSMQLEGFAKSIDNIFSTNMQTLENQINYLCKEAGIDSPNFKPSQLDSKAQEIIPLPSLKLANSGTFRIERSINELSKEQREKFPVEKLANTTELCALINGKNSALDIKKMLDTQFRKESDLQSVINYLKLLEIAGLVEL